MSTNTIKVTITGNLTAKPTQKEVGDEGQTVTEFTLANNPYGKESADFYKVELWGKRGDALVEHLDKGSKVIVFADRMRQGIWKNSNTGDPQAQIILTAQSVEFC